MRWPAFQYGVVWDRTYVECDQNTQELLDRRLDLLCEHGNQSGRPISAPLGDGIFELRANDARMLYYFGSNHDIIFVHCLIKKTRKVAREDIELAKRRRAQIPARGIKPNALPN
jgi:phage-related protein